MSLWIYNNIVVSVIRKTRAKMEIHKRKRILDGESHKDSDSFHIRFVA